MHSPQIALCLERETKIMKNLVNYPFWDGWYPRIPRNPYGEGEIKTMLILDSGYPGIPGKQSEYLCHDSDPFLLFFLGRVYPRIPRKQCYKNIFFSLIVNIQKFQENHKYIYSFIMEKQPFYINEYPRISRKQQEKTRALKNRD